MEEILGKLKKYFSERDDILMAFLFGSQAKGLARSESDIDIAIYLKTQSGDMDFERILGKKVDLVILNRAPAGVAFAAINSGKEICAKNPGLRTKFVLLASAVAAEMRDFARDFLAIQARSESLNVNNTVRT